MWMAGSKMTIESGQEIEMSGLPEGKYIAKNLASGCAAEEGRLLLDLCYRTHNAGDAQEEAPLFVTDRSVGIGGGKPVPLVCGSTGKTGE